MSKTIDFRVEDGVAVIAIDVPGQSMNVINATFIEEFETAVRRVLEDDEICGAVVTSAKKDFMAGADLRMLSAMTAMAKTASAGEVFTQAFRLNRLFRLMETGGKPVRQLQKERTKPFVAAVHGQALGGGFELPLACHFRVATSDARTQFGLPEVMVGLLPGAGGTQRLPRVIGIQAALQYLTTGKKMSAAEAKGFGIVHELVESREELIAKAKELVKANPKTLQPWDQRGFRFPGGAGAMNPKAVQTFMAANAMAQAKTWGLYPAVRYILACVYEGGIVPIDRALALESKYFTRLMVEGQAARMIRTLFVNKQAAEKGARRPKDVPEQPTKKLGMLGAGLMGAGIAYVSAKAGIEVVLLDRTIEAAEKGKDYSRRLVEKAVKRARMTAEEGDALLARIHPTAEHADLKGVDLVIEAVFEDREVKAETTKKTEAVTGPDIIFGSNTSTLPITSLAENWSKPENFIGIHFFSPVEKMPLVEIIVGKKTGPRAIAKALDYVRQIRKTPIVVNDSRGFYTSRSFGTYVAEGYIMIAEGVNPALIENAGRLIGMPVGPLAVGDEVGIDLSYKVLMQTKKDLGEAYRPTPADDVIITMVEKLERYGRKNGKGFYDYPEGGKKHLWPGIAEHFPRADVQPDIEEVKKRLLDRQIVEALRCFAEGVLETPEDGDIGAIFGWGFAPWTGGPFTWVDDIGLSRFIEEADALADRFGDRFRLPDEIRKRAEEGLTFYPAPQAVAAAAE